MKYIIYRITNIINDKIYVGKHKTDDIHDSYMGSGILITKAIKKYGVENFKKDILFVFDTEDLMNEKEIEIVDEDFISKTTTYNLALGGTGAFDINGDNFSKGHVTVRDENGKSFNVKLDDPRYLSGELVQASTNYKWMYKDNARTRVFIDDIDKHIQDGWKLGRFAEEDKVKPKSTSKKCIHKDGKELRVNNSCLEAYLQDGWELGRLNVKRRCIHKDGKELRVPITELSKYLNDGWSVGRTKLRRSCWRTIN